MPIKVLHITGNMRLGGAQVCIKYLIEQGDQEEIKTYVYPLRRFPVDMSIEGNVIGPDYRNYDLRKFWALWRICREHEVDIIHAHLHKPVMGALLASFLVDVRVVVHEHGPIFRRGIQYAFYRFMLRLLRGRADGVIAVSQATADKLMQKAKIDRERITVIYNAVDLERFEAEGTAREATRRQWEISKDDIVIGYVGRLDYVKGVDLLLEAFALLAKESERYFLLVVGDGPQRRCLEEQVRQLGVEHRVKFTGFCDNVPEVMQGFDLGVMPSRQEPFGMVALELMRMKIPLVCSGVEGLAEIVTHEETALVPEENDPIRIAKCVARLAGDAELRKRLSEAAYHFTEQFGIEAYVKGVEALYTQVLRKEDEP